jgi:dTDP-4-dehydrorhamnose 3,5-epimerase
MYFDVEIIGDDRGALAVLEKGMNLPFELKRSYYIFGTKNDVSRGYHAHKTLQQVAICVAGECSIVLDNGKTRQEYLLNSPTKGLFIDSMRWREMHNFSENCVLIVFANEYYDESDYIRDYAEFLRRVKQGNKFNED